MADVESGKNAQPGSPQAREKLTGRRSEHELRAGGTTLRYTANADCLVLRKKGKPLAEMFFVHYALAGNAPRRPVTFVFNGGPGAASAYLHVGALGPRRVALAGDGTLLPPPTSLVDNESSWLAFTDLVFVDPVGTGWSRMLDEAPPAVAKGDAGDGKPKDGADNDEFFQVKRDLDSLCEFISKFLSQHKLWSRPVFIAGESYGGFRVAKLARQLQETAGVGLSGAIAISPALELSLLDGSDYDVLMWADLFPSLVAASVQHGRSRVVAAGTALEEFLPAAERFAGNQLLRLLAGADLLPADERDAIVTRMADYLGLDAAFVARRAGRISAAAFVRELLRDERRVLGLYDASVTALDPFPDRDAFEGPDPTLFAISRVFTAGINMQLREELGVDTERDYELLNVEVNNTWKVDTRKHAFEFQVGAMDDLRYGMTLNPHLRVLITHGYFDLVTPYFASARLAGLMKLTDAQREQLTLQHFPGGHMFYAWDDSRRRFAAMIQDFYASALGAA